MPHSEYPCCASQPRWRRHLSRDVAPRYVCMGWGGRGVQAANGKGSREPPFSLELQAAADTSQPWVLLLRPTMRQSDPGVPQAHDRMQLWEYGRELMGLSQEWHFTVLYPPALRHLLQLLD